MENGSWLKVHCILLFAQIIISELEKDNTKKHKKKWMSHSNITLYYFINLYEVIEWIIVKLGTIVYWFFTFYSF